MQHGFYVVTILGQSSMIPINWCQATYGKTCTSVPVSHKDAASYIQYPTFVGYVCKCPNGFTAPLAPETTYSNNCTIESCQSSECTPTGVDSVCRVDRGAVTCTLATTVAAVSDLVFTLAVGGSCPYIVLLNNNPVQGTPLTITTPDMCYMSFTTSQQVTSITVASTDTDIEVSTGPCLHCVCDRPVSDPLCHMNLDLAEEPCPDFETAVYAPLLTQSAVFSTKTHDIAQVKFSLPEPSVVDAQLMFAIRSPAVITGTGPECLLIGDSAGFAMGSFAADPAVAYYAETVTTGAVSVSITGYFMLPRGFDAVGYKFIVAQRCATLDAPATVTTAVPCNMSSAYISCQTESCVTVLDGPRAAWNTIIVPRAPGALQVILLLLLDVHVSLISRSCVTGMRRRPRGRAVLRRSHCLKHHMCCGECCSHRPRDHARTVPCQPRRRGVPGMRIVRCYQGRRHIHHPKYTHL